MAYKTSYDGQQRIMNRLADSVLELTDEEILAEVRDSGIDSQQEANRITSVLLRAVDRWQSENERLSNLGHTINPNHWECFDGIYQNHRQSCGLLVSFSTTTQRMAGSALHGSCRKNEYTIQKSATSVKQLSAAAPSVVRLSAMRYTSIGSRTIEG
jgi:hypothetical protein